MPLSAPNSAYVRSDTPRCEQGDIYRDVKLIEWAELQGSEIKLAERSLPYCILLSQDCDLEHDFNNRAEQDPAKKIKKDKYLQSLLVCPAYPAEEFRAGDHLKKLGMKMEEFNSNRWPFLTHNTNPRYHFLHEDLDRQVPPLVIDFKHYITVPRDIVYGDLFQAQYLATMEVLFRDNLSGRFAHYLSRIGLPELVSP